MTDSRPLSKVADDELLRRLAELVGQSRRTEVELVAHIAEVEARRLYAREASPSMFVYCTEVLHLSEAEAYLRICAARASREHPVLLAMLGDGRLHLSGVARLAPHLTPANRDRVLARAAHRSKRQILELVAELQPRPDVPDRVTRLRGAGGGPSLASAGPASRDVPPAPHPRAVRPRHEDAGDGPGERLVPRAEPRDGNAQLRPDTVGCASAGTGRQSASGDAGAPSLAVGRVGARDGAPPAGIEPLAPGRYRVQFTAGRELHDKLDRLRALLPLGAMLDLASIIELAVTEKIESLEARRFGATRQGASDPAVKVGSGAAKACGSAIERRGSARDVRPVAPARSRYVPVSVRRAVRRRDGNRCTYEDDAGRRCSSRGHLEFHHLQPFGMGGEHSARNVRLVCHAHNAYLAEVDYGRAAVSRHLGRASSS